MDGKDWDALSDGDVVRHKLGGKGYTVGGNYGGHGRIIVRTQLVHNPDEWDLVHKAKYHEGVAKTPWWKRLRERLFGA